MSKQEEDQLLVQVNLWMCFRECPGSWYASTAGCYAQDGNNVVEQAVAMEEALVMKYYALVKVEPYWTRCEQTVLLDWARTCLYWMECLWFELERWDQAACVSWVQDSG